MALLPCHCAALHQPPGPWRQPVKGAGQECDMHLYVGVCAHVCVCVWRGHSTMLYAVGGCPSAAASVAV